MANLSAVFDIVDKVSAKLDSICGAGDKVAASFGGVELVADKVFANFDDGATAIVSTAESAAQSTDYWTDALGNYDKKAMEAIYTTEELVDLGYKSRDALEAEEKAAEEAARQLGGLGDKSEEAAEKSEKFGKKSTDAVSSLDTLLATAGIVAALTAIAMGFGKCADAAQEFETASAKVATIADTTQISMKSIDNAIIDLSNDTGQASNDLAESVYSAISASVDTADAVQFVKESNELAVGGFTSVANSVDVLSTALNSYNLEADQAGQVADYLIMTQNLGKTTVDELSSSVARVIPLASAYNVQMDNLSSAYAVLTSNGIDTAESTTYIRGMLAELADTGSTVAGILEDQTGESFANLMAQGYSLGDVLQILGDSVNGNATAFSNMWSSMEAGTGALSIFNSGAEKYNSVLEKMQSSQGATSDAFNTMANTSAMAESKMNQAFNNMSIGIGEKLQPQMNDLYETGSKVFIGMTDFVEEHPSVIYAIEGIATSLGIMVAGITGYVAVTKVAALVTEAFTGTLLTNPVFIGITGIAVVTGALVGLAAAVSNANEDSVEYTATSRRMIETTGELTNTQEDALETMDEYRQKTEEIANALEEEQRKHQEAIDSINSEYDSSVQLISRMEQLNSVSNKTEFQHEALANIVAELNSRYENLGLTYDSVTGSINKTAISIEKMVKAEAEAKRRQADYDLWVENTVNLANAQDDVVEKQKEVTAQQELANEALQKYYDTGDESLYTQYLNEAGALQERQEEFKKVQEKVEEAMKTDKEYADKFGENSDKASEAITTQSEAVETAVTSMQTRMNDLAQAYDAAYNSARESIEGQIGLFDSMKTESDMSVSDMEKAFESQVAYLDRYTENLNKAKEYGLNTDLVQSLSDGGTESAGRLDALISKIEKLGTSQQGMSESAKKFVTDFNDSYSRVDEAEDSLANAMVKISSNLDEEMDKIGADMQDSIGKMSLEDEAAEAATKTIRAYINAIKSMTGDVTTATQAVTNATNNALAGVYAPSYNDIPGFKFDDNGVKTAKVAEANAEGTTDSSDVYIAGEEGPELIVGRRGSKVFPTAETEKIVNAVGGNVGGSSEEKKITIDINGSGSISVDKSVDKQSILETIQENIKPILLNIISKEVYEEGDLSYEY